LDSIQQEDEQNSLDKHYEYENMQSQGDESSEMDKEDEAVQRLERICECAHKIIAKYTSNGMIKYSDAP
jgi:hypothetical protein